MPDWNAPLTARLARVPLRPAREREIVDELSQHLDDRYQELRAAGTSHEDAMRLALVELDDEIADRGDGAPGVMHEDLLARELRRLRQASMPEPVVPGRRDVGWAGGVWQDLVYACRMLRKSPGFAAAAILTLALGIGANTAIFSLVNATLLQRLPVQNHDRLLYVFNGANWNVISYPAYAHLRDGSRLVDGLAAWGGITASLNADGETDLVNGLIVTGNLFEILGVSAERGRLLSKNDDVTPGAHPVAVISHRLWQTRFNGKPDIVGSEIRLNGGVFTVVGVTPPAFPGPQVGAVRDLYVPMMMQALMRPPRAGYSGEQNPDLLRNPNNGWLFQVALRKPTVTAEQVQAEFLSLATVYLRSRAPNAPLPRLALVPVDVGDQNQRQQMRSVATLLGAVVGVVLLIACANVANLLLSKAAARRREVAIRLALGASRWRIVRQMLTESVLLSMIGGALGVLFAWLAVQSFVASVPPAAAVPVTLDFVVDRRLLLFSLVLSILTGVIFGSVPALQASRPELVAALKDEAAPDGGARWFNLKKALVVSEVALSLLLLVAAGLFIRSLSAMQAVDPGVAVGELVAAPLGVNLLRYTKAQGREFYQEVVARLERLPGVRSATVARVAILSGGGRVTTVAVEGRPDSGNRGQSEGGGVAAAADQSFVNVIGPRFFDTLGIPLVRGRDFDSRDIEGHPLVAIASETLAKQFFPGEDAIGKRFSTARGGPNGPWIEIVGIAKDSKYQALREAPVPVVYFPLAQQHETGVALYVRATVPPRRLVADIRREIQAIEPNLPVPNIQTMSDVVGVSLYAPRMGATLLSVFGALALLLASLGVYGVLAYSIARRTREIGIRMALGADRQRVFALILGEGMKVVGVGLVIGLGAGLYASKWIKTFLFDVSTHDLTTFAVVPCVLMLVALLACYLPARRAMRVDPMVALRDS